MGKSMASDIVGILDREGLHGKERGKVIGIAHDWGTYLLSQLAVWYEDRFEKLVFFSVPFSPPGSMCPSFLHQASILWFCVEDGAGWEQRCVESLWNMEDWGF